ncbi:HRDC domain-containing protein [Corynebacterium sp. B5-R-101]|uniref:HRDC domain-containing protein n=1 Tax=Corynebacterium intestinale TaxID=2943492 RepID=A0ABT0TC56_9CORY|nr:HRDC domain-containing protein [Corynebacterium intestinale]MCL8494664.1 HRDC domain-containing protein [Corynebacterium intestinale]MCP1390900.1 HRDC domain-containing protein [Corynebacterium intestinale]
MTELRQVPVDGTPKVLLSPREFHAAADRLAAGTGPFAIDTERASAYRYDDRAFLVQIRREGAGTFLFAPEHRRAELRAALAPVLNGQEWVVHAAPSDLPCLAWLGLYPGTLFDTELAARFAGFAHPNLAAMVLELFDVQLEKGYGDSDWSETPIPRSWRNYAALDVELLNELAVTLRDILAEEEKLDWAYEEFEKIVDDHARIKGPEPRSWRDLKGVSSLRSGEQLAVARELWQRRESIARTQDVAPNRVLPHRVLVDIARRVPRSPREINQIKGFPRRRGGATLRWFDAVETALASPRKQWPKVLRSPRPVPSKSVFSREFPELWQLYTEIRSDFEDLGDELGMSYELILKPSLLRMAVWAACGPEGGVAGEITDASDIPDFLRSQGAREWQIELASPLLRHGLEQ